MDLLSYADIEVEATELLNWVCSKGDGGDHVCAVEGSDAE